MIDSHFCGLLKNFELYHYSKKSWIIWSYTKYANTSLNRISLVSLCIQGRNKILKEPSYFDTFLRVYNVFYVCKSKTDETLSVKLIRILSKNMPEHFLKVFVLLLYNHTRISYSCSLSLNHTYYFFPSLNFPARPCDSKEKG